MPRHKKKKRAAAAAAGAKRTDWLVGDLVVAKLRGHRPWPAQIQNPEDYGYAARPHRIFVTFYGTEETCFCSYNKITPFTTAVRKSLAEQLQKINTNPELERAIKEIFAADDEHKLSLKAHGSHANEDDVASEKSEEEPPVELTRKRARVVEEPVTEVNVVEYRPARQEKTVSSMAVEQVQKLPRKVRIKVSTQSSDSVNQQGFVGALPGSDKASVSSLQCDISSHASEAVASGKLTLNNGDSPTTVKVDDSSVNFSPSLKLKENGEDIEAEAGKVVGNHSLNGDEAAEKMEVNNDGTGMAFLKVCDDEVEKTDMENQILPDLKMSAPKEDVVIAGDNESVADDDLGGKFVTSKASEPAVGEEDQSLPIDIESVPDDDSAAKVEDSARVLIENEHQSRENTVSKEGDSRVAEELDSSSAQEGQSCPVTKEVEVTQSTEPDSSERKEQVSPVTKEDEVMLVKEQDTSEHKEQVPMVTEENEVMQLKKLDSEGVAGPESDRKSGSEREGQDLSVSMEHDEVDEAKKLVFSSTELASEVEDVGKEVQEELKQEQAQKEEDSASMAEVLDSAIKEQSSVAAIQLETVAGPEKQDAADAELSSRLKPHDGGACQSDVQNETQAREEGEGKIQDSAAPQQDAADAEPVAPLKDQDGAGEVQGYAAPKQEAEVGPVAPLKEQDGVDDNQGSDAPKQEVADAEPVVLLKEQESASNNQDSVALQQDATDAAEPVIPLKEPEAVLSSSTDNVEADKVQENDTCKEQVST